MDLHQVYITFLILALLSLTGTVILLVFFYRRRQALWNTSSYTVVFMSLCDLCFALAMIIACGRPLITSTRLTSSDFLCYVSYLLVTSGSTGITWYAAMALNVFLLCQGMDEKNLRKLRPYQHAFAWLYNLGSFVVPVLQGGIGPIGDFDECYFPDSHDPRRWIIYALVTVMCGLSLLLLSYACFIYYFRRASMDRVLTRLVLLMGFELTWSLALVERYYNWFTGQSLGNLQLICMSSSGLCNFIVWVVFNPTMNGFNRICPCVPESVISCCAKKGNNKGGNPNDDAPDKRRRSSSASSFSPSPSFSLTRFPRLFRCVYHTCPCCLCLLVDESTDSLGSRMLDSTYPTVGDVAYSEGGGGGGGGDSRIEEWREVTTSG